MPRQYPCVNHVYCDGWTCLNWELKLYEANGRLARMRSIIKSHSFAVVLSGETGKRYVRCKECHGDNENKSESDFDFTHVKHFSPCSVAAALKETE